MKIRCKHCKMYFCPGSETLELLSEGYITSESCNVCDDCFDLIEHPEYDYSEMYYDGDLGL